MMIHYVYISHPSGLVLSNNISVNGTRHLMTSTDISYCLITYSKQFGRISPLHSEQKNISAVVLCESSNVVLFCLADANESSQDPR